jgi:tRNA(Ile)-lysidine synthase
MSDILSSLETLFVNYPDNNLLVAYSGGVDSQVLLHALATLKTQKRINQSITVCHVNHGLSDNAKTWQEFAVQQCKLVGFPLHICEVNVENISQQSLEALARDARYQALKSVANNNDFIVTGHHSDDQAETFLLALKRGSGLKGLSAMKPIMAFGKQFLVRPLLKNSRQDIERYAKTHHLQWIEDESNQDTRFDRNFLRHKILPLINERWPSFNATLSRSAEHCAQEQELLNELAAQDLVLCQQELRQSVGESLTVLPLLTISVLNTLSTARFNNVIRYFLEQHNALMPSKSQLREIKQQITAASDKSPTIQLAEYCFRRYKNTLFLTDIYQDISTFEQSVELSNNEDTNVVLPNGLGCLVFAMTEDKDLESSSIALWETQLLAPKAAEVISVRFSHNNPKCTPDYREHSRALKKVLQELDISPWQRKRIPFIYYDETLVAVAGYFICKEYIMKANLSSQVALLNLKWLRA